jgi:hypothetical protein
MPQTIVFVLDIDAVLAGTTYPITIEKKRGDEQGEEQVLRATCNNKRMSGAGVTPTFHDVGVAAAIGCKADRG